MKLLIVESPNKTKTIAGFLGNGWSVKASVGHITELANDGEDNLGFDITRSGVNCRYVPRGERGAKVIKELRALAQKAEIVYLATDPDREGESISWHLKEQLGLRTGKYRRITYTQITESAVKEAIAHARDLDMDLVSAQFARQTLDKLVGFKGSKLVQRASAGQARSAGRVQSAALHIVCQREREIQGFKPVPYWSVQVEYEEGFKAFYLGTEATRSVQPVEAEDVVDESADPVDGQQEQESQRVSSQADADRIVAIAQNSPHQVVEFAGTEGKKNPPPPLTTSALQQAAGVRYGYSSEQVMKLAQELFEGVDLPDGSRHGAITYHRTDSTSLAPEFCEAVRHWLQENHPDIVPAKAKVFKDKDGAQGAHEAIRPVEVGFTPDAMLSHLTEAQHNIYTLIWQRAIASQCAPATYDKSRVVIKAGATYWEARGSVMKSPGFTKILRTHGEDSELPSVKTGDTLRLLKAWHTAKKTTPPPRYTEPRLVQVLEKLGIGRPSTFANIVKILKDREFVSVKGKALVPTALGLKTDQTLSMVLPDLISPDFTAKMESSLDRIAEGDLDWQKYLTSFYFGFFLPALESATAKSLVMQAYPKSEMPCPDCGKLLSKLPSKFKNGAKDYYLKCMEGCSDVVLFWSQSANRWMRKGESNSSPSNPRELTDFVCQCCGAKLEKYVYQKDGQEKLMLRCSAGCYKKPEMGDLAIYFQTKKGFWNFRLNSEPLKEFKQQAKTAVKEKTVKEKTVANRKEKVGEGSRSSRKK